MVSTCSSELEGCIWHLSNQALLSFLVVRQREYRRPDERLLPPQFSSLQRVIPGKIIELDPIGAQTLHAQT